MENDGENPGGVLFLLNHSIEIRVVMGRLRTAFCGAGTKIWLGSGRFLALPLGELSPKVTERGDCCFFREKGRRGPFLDLPGAVFGPLCRGMKKRGKTGPANLGFYKKRGKTGLYVRIF